jgi:hypothetical protein
LQTMLWHEQPTSRETWSKCRGLQEKT